MILHMVSFTWKHEVTDLDVAQLTRELTVMASRLPALRGYRCGVNLRLRPSDADYAVAALVDDPAGLEAYLDSKEHADVYSRLLGRMTAHRTAVQLDIGADVRF